MIACRCLVESKKTTDIVASETPRHYGKRSVGRNHQGEGFSGNFPTLRKSKRDTTESVVENDFYRSRTSAPLPPQYRPRALDRQTSVFPERTRESRDFLAGFGNAKRCNSFDINGL